MIAGQDHDRHAELAHHPGRVLEQRGWQAVVLKGIAGQDHEVGARRRSSGQHLAQNRQGIGAGLVGAVVGAQVEIRAVDNDHFALRAGIHG